LDLTWDEFWHWIAYFEMEPPNRAEDYRAAMICAQVYNTAGKAFKKNVTPEQILGLEKEASKPKQYQTAAEQKAFLRGLGSKP
jgi:hypothetical protein